MSPTDPKPLLLEEGTSDALKSILESAAAHEPGAPDLARLEAKLAAALPAGALPLASAAKGSAVVTKVVVGVVVATVVGAAAWIVMHRGEGAPAPVPTKPPVVENQPSEVATNEVARTVDSLPNAEPSSSAPIGRPHEPARENVVAEPEAAILADAHAALLHGAPDKALARANDHRRSYPSGALTQEREVIAIEALVALGRRAEAIERARAFRARYPTSTHLEKIDRLGLDPKSPKP